MGAKHWLMRCGRTASIAGAVLLLGACTRPGAGGTETPTVGATARASVTIARTATRISSPIAPSVAPSTSAAPIATATIAPPAATATAPAAAGGKKYVVQSGDRRAIRCHDSADHRRELAAESRSPSTWSGIDYPRAISDQERRALDSTRVYWGLCVSVVRRGSAPWGRMVGTCGRSSAPRGTGWRVRPSPPPRQPPPPWPSRRNLLLAILRAAGWTNITDALRHYGAYAHRALTLLGALPLRL